MNPPAPEARGRGGVSLVEGLLVTLLVGVALLPLYDVLLSSTRGNRASAERVRAADMAAALMETIKAIPFAELPVTEPGDSLGWSDDQVADRARPGPGARVEPADLGLRFEPVTGRVVGFERWLRIDGITTRGDGSGEGDVKRVVVTVRWDDPASPGGDRSVLQLLYLHTPRVEDSL